MHPVGLLKLSFMCWWALGGIIEFACGILTHPPPKASFPQVEAMCSHILLTALMVLKNISLITIKVGIVLSITLPSCYPRINIGGSDMNSYKYLSLNG